MTHPLLQREERRQMGLNVFSKKSRVSVYFPVIFPGCYGAAHRIAFFLNHPVSL